MTRDKNGRMALDLSCSADEILLYLLASIRMNVVPSKQMNKIRGRNRLLRETNMYA